MNARLPWLLLLVTTLAMAKTPERKPFLTGKVDCNLFLENSTAGKIEEFFLSQATTEEDMTQLLTEYGLVASQRFNEALQLLVQEQGAPLEDVKVLTSKSKNKNKATNSASGVSLTREESKKFILALEKFKSIYELRGAEASTFVHQLIERVISLASAGKELPVAQVEHHRLSRLAQAARSSSQRDLFEKVIADHIRQTLMLTSNALIEVLKVGWFQKNLDLKSLGIVAGGILPIVGIDFTIFQFVGLDDLMSEPLLGPLWCLMHWVVVPIGGAIGYDFGEHLGKRLAKKKTQIYQLEGSSKPLLASNFYDVIEKPLSAKVIGLGAACSGDVCDITPVEMAYIGHLDLVELEIAFNELKKSFQDDDLKGLTKIIREQALILLEKSDSVAAQLRLAHAISKLNQSLQNSRSVRGAAIDLLVSRVERTKRNMELLQEKAYGDSRELSHDRLEKYIMYMAKAETDLATVGQLRISTDVLAARQKELEDLIALWNQLIGEMPRSSKNWQDFAEKVSFALDRMNIE